MKKILLLITMLLAISSFSFKGIAAPSFNAPTSVDVVAGTGENQIVLTNVTDITSFSAVTVAGGTASLVESSSVVYTAGQRFAVLKFNEKGQSGTVTLKVTSGAASKDITVNIKTALVYGILAELYDMAQWEEESPIANNTLPAISELLPTASFPYIGDGFWTSKIDKIRPNWTYGGNSIGQGGSSGMKGFFLPPADGNYTFTYAISNNSNGAFYIDANAGSWRDAVVVISRGGKYGSIGTSSTVSGRNYRRSAPISLKAGKAYPIFSTNWDYAPQAYEILVSGSGMTDKVLDGNMIAPMADNVKPDMPQNVKIQAALNTGVLVVWDAVASGKKIARVKGYNVYVDGVKKNTDPVTGARYLVEGLSPGTKYDLFVTAVDEVSNESLISSTVSTTTTATTTATPSAPDGIIAENITGETIKLKWNKGTNVAFDVYVGGSKVNADYIYDDTFFIRNLQEKTTYSVQVKAYNSSLVGSALSGAKSIATIEFDPTSNLGTELGEFSVRLNIEARNISWTEGLGVNAPSQNGSLLTNAASKKLCDDLKPGLIRWGDLGANERTFEKNTSGNTSASSIGNKSGTHAKILNYCNQMGAYYSLCTGTQANSDYMTEPLTFLHLIEYLAGPADTHYGKIRADEGFSAPLLAKGTCKGLLLEFGNEVWGGESHKAPIGNNYSDKKYAEYCRAMADTIRTSPYWEDIKDLVYFVYSGRDPVLGQQNSAVIEGDNGNLNTLGVSGYLGGNMNYNPEVDYGQSISEYYRLRQSHMKTNISGLQSLMRKEIEDNGVAMYSFFYETQVSMFGYFGNLGQAVVLNDYLTSVVPYGSIAPAIFHLTDRGQWRTCMNDNTPLASYTMAKYINNYCKGHILSTNVETNNTLWLDENQEKPLLDHDPVGASAYNNGKRWSVLLFSRDFEHDYTVQLNLPDNIGAISGAKKYIVTGDGTDKGPSIRASYTTGESNITLTDGLLVTVPKYSMVLITFEANDPEFEQLPLAHFDRTVGTEIELTGDFLIDTNKGSTRITSTVLPEGTFSTAVKWEFLRSDNPAYPEDAKFPMLLPSIGSVLVRANVSPICNGEVVLRATLYENPEVTVKRRIYISNQANATCTIGVEESEVSENAVYPNPADDVLYVKTSDSDNMAVVNVYNNVGVRVMAETSATQLFELNVSGLVPGHYIVSVEKDGKVEKIPFVKK